MNSQEVAQLKSLVYDQQTTVLILPKGTKTFGEGAALKAELDLSNLSSLEKSVSALKDIELMVLNLDEQTSLNRSYDFSALSSLNNLKYILVICSYQCDREQIENAFAGLPQEVLALYNISIPQ
ncbi:MAG: hypothetical protein WBL27_01250 [Salinimicrobium sp.]